MAFWAVVQFKCIIYGMLKTVSMLPFSLMLNTYSSPSQRHVPFRYCCSDRKWNFMMSLPSTPNRCGEKMVKNVSDEELCSSAKSNFENQHSSSPVEGQHAWESHGDKELNLTVFWGRLQPAMIAFSCREGGRDLTLSELGGTVNGNHPKTSLL